MSEKNLLKIENLSISFGAKNESVEVVRSVSFTVVENEIVAVVGESGSGKSVTSLAVMGLLPKKNCQVLGEILFEGKNLLKLSNKELLTLRGNDISMIFQEPMSALNPSLSCGFQVAEILSIHTKLSSRERKKEVLRLFEKVKLPRPSDIYDSYPHQISGGQMQRVMIAMAIACKPKLLIADEPTTALDVTVQKEILQLLKELQKETGMSLLFISHDLAVVKYMADQLLVMNAGEIEELGDADEIYANPTKEYTKKLIDAIPKGI